MAFLTATTFMAFFVYTIFQAEALECFDNEDESGLTTVSECEAGVEFCTIQVHPETLDNVLKHGLNLKRAYSCASELHYCKENGEGCHRDEDRSLVCCCKADFCNSVDYAKILAAAPLCYDNQHWFEEESYSVIYKPNNISDLRLVQCSQDEKFCSTDLRHGLEDKFGQDEVMWYGCVREEMCNGGRGGTGYNFLDTNDGRVDIEFCCDGDGCNAESMMEPPRTTTTTTENPSLKLGEMLFSILDDRYVKRSSK